VVVFWYIGFLWIGGRGWGCLGGWGFLVLVHRIIKAFVGGCGVCGGGGGCPDTAANLVTQMLRSFLC